MKKLLSFILCVTLLLGVFPFVLPVTAVETVDVRSTEFGNLYDNAVFVSNAGNDTTGKVNDKTKPFATINAAANALIAAHDGGYIVIMDAITCSVDVDYNDHNGVICITSVYDDVDYRNSGAMIVGGNATFAIMLSGSTIIENIDLKVFNNGASESIFYIAARHNPLQIGDDNLNSDDVRFYNGAGTLINKNNVTAVSNKVIVHGGYVKGKVDKVVTSDDNKMLDMGTETNVIIKSGCYTWVSGGNYGISVSGLTSNCITKNFVEVHAGYVDQLFAGNVSAGLSGVTVSYLLGGEVKKFSPGTNLTNLYLRGNTYTVLGGCSVGTIVEAAHQGTGLYDVIIYDSAVYPNKTGLPSYSGIEHIIPMMDQSAENNIAYVKLGASGDGSSTSSPCVDITAAYLVLGDNGGTIKLCDNYTFATSGSNLCEYNYLGASTALKYFIAPYHSGKVTIDGGGYALTTGKLVFALSGPTEITNVNISCSGGLFVVARFNDLSMDKVTNDRMWVVGAESLAHSYGKADVSHRNRGRYTTTDRSSKIELDGIELEELYVFSGNAPHGQNYTGKITVELTDTTVTDGTVLGVRGVTGCIGSSGSVDFTINGETSINKFWPASSLPANPMTGDINVTVNGGNINTFGNANFVEGTAKFIDNTGNAEMCKKAAYNGFDEVTGYVTVAIENPNNITSTGVKAIYVDGLSVVGNDGNLRILKPVEKNFTMLVPEDTTASTIQIFTADGNYAYTVCPVESVMTATRAEAFDNAFANVGFAIRSVETENRGQGLRFKTSITKVAAEAAAEFGLLAKKTANTDSLVLANVDTGANGDVAKSIAANDEVQYIAEETADTLIYATAISGIPEEKAAYETSFTFRPYVTAEIGGKTYTFYGDEDKSSIYDVAAAATGEDVTAFVTSVITTVEGTN